MQSKRRLINIRIKNALCLNDKQYWALVLTGPMHWQSEPVDNLHYDVEFCKSYSKLINCSLMMTSHWLSTMTIRLSWIGRRKLTLSISGGELAAWLISVPLKKLPYDLIHHDLRHMMTFRNATLPEPKSCPECAPNELIMPILWENVWTLRFRRPLIPRSKKKQSVISQSLWACMIVTRSHSG
jgi:hypothetical protein